MIQNSAANLPLIWQVPVPAYYGTSQFPKAEDVALWMERWCLPIPLQSLPWQITIVDRWHNKSRQQDGWLLQWISLPYGVQTLSARKLGALPQGQGFQPRVLTGYRRVGYTKFFGAFPTVTYHHKLAIRLVLLEFT